MPGISAKRSDKPSWPTSQSASRCSPTTLSPTTRTASRKAPLRRERGPVHLPHTRRRRCHELAGGAGDPPGGREPQGLGGNRTWRGAATQARMMSLIRTAAQQNLDVIEFLTRLAGHPRRRTYRRFSRRTTPPPLVIHRDGLSRDPLSKYLAGTTTPSHLARPVVTPASFLSLARSGIDGTFTAVYKLSAPTSSAESDATVTVAQRAASGTTAWPGGKPGSGRIDSPTAMV